MSWYNPVFLLWLSAICLQIHHHQVQAHAPPPQANDIFGTVNGCASALVEMDDNQDGMVKKDEYLDFVNLLADFLCIPPRPIMDLEIQTVFFSIACLCQEREGFEMECCFGNDAAIWTEGAADAITRTEDQDSYLRASCLLTQAILGPDQCTKAPATLSPEAIVNVGPLVPFSSKSGLSDDELWAIIIGAILLLLLCCLLLFCGKKKTEEEEEEIEEIIVKEEEIEQGEVDVDEVKKVEPVEMPMEEEAEEPPIQESNALPKEPAPVAAPAPPPPPAPPIVPLGAAAGVAAGLMEDDESDSENIGRRVGVTMDDDEEDESNRKFAGQGMLPNQPYPEGVQLRHIETEKEEPGEYDYPEREFHENQRPPDEDSVQEFDPYIPDGGVYDPQRAPRAPVVFAAPKYQRDKPPTPEPYDPRKFRKQLNLGDGEVWDSLAAHEDKRAQTKENKFEWIVQSALDVLARANESGDLTKPKPTSMAPRTPPTKKPLEAIYSV